MRGRWDQRRRLGSLAAWQKYDLRRLRCRSRRFAHPQVRMFDRATAVHVYASSRYEGVLGHRRWCRRRRPLTRRGRYIAPYSGRHARHCDGSCRLSAGAVTVCRCCSPVRAELRSAGAGRAGREERLCFGQSTYKAGAMCVCVSGRVGDSVRCRRGSVGYGRDQLLSRGDGAVEQV